MAPRTTGTPATGGRQAPSPSSPAPEVRFGFSVTNFRAIGGPPDSATGVSVDLGPLNILLGPNGAGKSSFIDALALFAAAGGQFGQRFPQLFARQGGFAEVVHRRTGRDEYREMAFEFADKELGVVYLAHPGAQGARTSLNIDRLMAPPSKVLLDRTGDRIQVFDERGGKNEDFGAASDSFGLSLVPEDMERFPTLTRLRQRLQRVYVMDLEAAALRESSRADQPAVLSPGGEGLPRYAMELVRREPKTWSDISDFINVAVPQLERVTVELDPDGRLRLYGYLAGSGVRVEARHLSTGTLRLLAMACVAYNPEPPSIWVIENADGEIHVGLQELVMQLLRSASKRTTVVASTHSPALLSEVRNLREVLLVEYGPQGTVIRHPTETSGLRDWIASHGLASAYETGLLRMAL